MRWLDLTDPKTQTWAAAIIAILSAIAQGTIKLPINIPANVVEVIQSWDTFIVSVWIIATPILFGVSKGAGPWAAPPDHPNLPSRGAAK